MIVYTFDRGGSSSLAAWQKANPRFASDVESIKWGNAVEAAKLPDGRRIALTPLHVEGRQRDPATVGKLGRLHSIAPLDALDVGCKSRICLLPGGQARRAPSIKGVDDHESKQPGVGRAHRPG